MTYLTYKYRILPTRAQHAALERILEAQRQLYNGALEERIEWYRKTGKTRTYFDQCRALAEWRRDDDEASSVPSNLQRWTIKRLDEAYKAFFRRVKANNGAAGFPRFRGASRWRSFGFSEFQGLRFDGKRIRFKGFPSSLRVHLHRPLPKEKLLSCVFSKDAKGWAVGFHVAAPEIGKRDASSFVGLDLGLKVFAYQSDGTVILAPLVGRRAARKIRCAERALARCKIKSKRRSKVKAKLTIAHAKIVNARATWLHQQSARIANSYDLIAAEDLNVSGMVRHPGFAKSIHDASWSTFISMLAYKAEKAGGQLVLVDPKYTSQRCSSCSELVPKSLAVRTHSCPHCGLTIDRDWNAARNILQAVVGLGQPNVTQWSKRAAGNIAQCLGESLS